MRFTILALLGVAAMASAATVETRDTVEARDTTEARDTVDTVEARDIFPRMFLTTCPRRRCLINRSMQFACKDARGTISVVTPSTTIVSAGIKSGRGRSRNAAKTSAGATATVKPVRLFRTVAARP